MASLAPHDVIHLPMNRNKQTSTTWRRDELKAGMTEVDGSFPCSGLR